MATNDDKKLAMQRARAVLDSFQEQHKSKSDGPTFDIDVMQRAKIVDATLAGTVTVEIEIGKEYSNSAGTLHGAASALLFDMFTSTAFAILYPKPPQSIPGGPSRALNITYLRPVRLPATVHIHGEVLQHGRSASFARGSITSLDGKKVFATCEHHKIALNPRVSNNRTVSKL